MDSPKNITKPAEADKPYNGWSNYDTYWTAHVIANDDNLYRLCNELYKEGYTSWGSLSNAMKIYGHKWQSHYTGLNYITWKNPKVRGPEMTKHLKSLFQPANENTKRT